MKKYIILFSLFVVYISYAQSSKREMRGVWIATVANIDWTLSPGNDTTKQKQEMINILDNVVANNMNTVIFQTRPTADALYHSSQEPWSHWLTGVQGEYTGYDPLQFVIDECNKRGLALHVWINPYRVWLDLANIDKATNPNHVYNRNKSWLVEYGKSVYLNPAYKDVRDYVSSVIADIVRHYDIDAVHLDDYFYPYKVPGVDFPDDKEFKSDARGFKNKNDWRRDNVDMIVKQISDTIKSIKPYVEFGVSPFGIWRNNTQDPRGSDTRGLSNYDDLYADILKWQKNGWIDYVAPLLYWHIGYKIADYKTLVEWWSENAYGTPLYIGHGSYNVNPKSLNKEWRSSAEIVRQIKLNRELLNIGGSMMYSAKSIATDEFKRSVSKIFSDKLLVPTNSRIKPIIPVMPEAAIFSEADGRLNFIWQSSDNNRRFVIYRFASENDIDTSNPSNIILVTGECSASLAVSSDEDYLYGITSLSPSHHESELVLFDIM